MSAGRSPDFASPNASDLVIAALIGGFREREQATAEARAS
jgi:hypothetical protein